MAKISDSESEHSSAESPHINPELIKPTPQQLQSELGRALPEGESRQSIRELQEASSDQLWQKTEAIYHQQLTPSLPEGQRALYRVHGRQGVVDLESEAEKRDQFASLTAEQKQSMIKAHAAQNRKAIGDDLHSPFVSTTSDLRELVSNTFSARLVADPNLRNEVFEHANFVSIFRVPQALCTDITDAAGGAEHEVLYDTSHGPLSSHRIGRYHDNPFQGRVQVQLDKMARSRGVRELALEATRLNEEYDKIPKDIPITQEIVDAYVKWHEAQKRFCDKVISMPKQRGAQVVLAADVVESDPFAPKPSIKRVRKTTAVAFTEPDAALDEKQVRERKVAEKTEAREGLVASLRSKIRRSPEDIEAVPRQGLYESINKVSPQEREAHREGVALVERDAKESKSFADCLRAAFQARQSTSVAPKPPPPQRAQSIEK
jgi:hypothetical protein